MDRPIISRMAAIEAGLEFYYTGKPCKRGHLGDRETMTAACAECRRGLRDYILQKRRERAEREAAEAATV